MLATNELSNPPDNKQHIGFSDINLFYIDFSNVSTIFLYNYSSSLSYIKLLLI